MLHRLLRTSSALVQRGVSVVLLLALLEVVALAASPELHAKAHHHDADDRDEDCVVTLFASGSVADQVAPPPVVASVDLPLVETLRMEVAREVFLARVEGRIRERAPPVSAA
jgi:hypothetical protein